MGDHLLVDKPSWYVTSHPGQLSLAIPPWVGAVSTSESWDVNRHTARCTGPVSVVWQCKLVSGWGLKKRRSAPPYGPYGSGRTLRFFSLLDIPGSDCVVYRHAVRMFSRRPRVVLLIGCSTPMKLLRTWLALVSPAGRRSAAMSTKLWNWPADSDSSSASPRQ